MDKQVKQTDFGEINWNVSGSEGLGFESQRDHKAKNLLICCFRRFYVHR